MARPVGINHVALEVGDVEAALAFYGALFEIRDVEREPGMAFVGLGDQFIALAEDGRRHLGLVVDDREAVRAALRREGVEVVGAPRLNFRDPWGNEVQVVQYSQVKFTKTPGVLRAMGLAGLEKDPPA